MKTLILAINARYMHTALAPWYLKAAVLAYNKQAAGQVDRALDGNKQSVTILAEPEILETNINRPMDEILVEIETACPDMLAVSCYIWNIALVAKLLWEVSIRLPNCILLLGGPEVSFNAIARLEALPMVDYIICGEGEHSFVRLLMLLEEYRRDGRLPKKATDLAAKLSIVPGLAWKREGAIVKNDGWEDTERSAEERAEAPPDPYLPEYMERIAGRIAYMETSRGCSFSCGFCLSGNEGGVVFFDLEQAKDNLVKMANSGAKTVKLVDRTFNCDPFRSLELISFLVESREAGHIPATVCFHLEVAADLFDQAAIDMLLTAPTGLFQLEMGIQSFHPETLAAIGRRSDLTKAKENIQRLREKNTIHLHVDMIAGLPYENYETFSQSFDSAFGLFPHMLQLGFLKLLYGSHLREQSARYGIVFDSNPPYRVRRTAWVTERELWDVELCEDALERLYNSGRFPETWRYLLATSRMGPFHMLSALGHFTGKSFGKPLEVYIAEMIAFGSLILGADSELLRDHLVIDWLKTNHVGVLPICLQKADPIKRKVERALNHMQKDKAAPSELGVRRAYGFGLLYGGGKTRVAVADYRQPKPYLGDYPCRIMDIGELL